MKIAALALVLPASLALGADGYCQWPPVPGATRYDGGATKGGGDTGRPARGGNQGPGDTVPSGPAQPANPGGASSGKPQNPTGSGPHGGPGTGPGPGQGGLAPTNMPTTPALTMTSDDSWYLWWEFNKAEFLRPNRLDLLSAPASGDDALGALQRFADSMRLALGPALLEALHDGDPNLRAVAAVAYGRTAGAAAIPRLVEMLGDAHVDVRHGALLGLGATGAGEAAALLLSIAKDGTRDGLGRERISPTAEAHAFVALAIGRKRGFPAFVDTH